MQHQIIIANIIPVGLGSDWLDVLNTTATSRLTFTLDLCRRPCVLPCGAAMTEEASLVRRLVQNLTDAAGQGGSHVGLLQKVNAGPENAVTPNNLFGIARGKKDL